VNGDEDVQKAFDRYETVEWLYDGLGGKVIKWTKANGNDHDDPSILVFVADVDGNVIEKSENAYQPAGFRKWLEAQADAYERAHPTTRVPFVRATVKVEGEGEERRAVCGELDDARDDGTPVLLYVGRSERPDDDKKAKSVVKASRKLEKGTLNAKSAAEAAEGVVLIRLDVANEEHALLAEQLGVEKVPTLLLFAPESEEPDDLGGRISGASLAHKLKSVPRGDE
jgi:hypothetical protein